MKKNNCLDFHGLPIKGNHYSRQIRIIPKPEVSGDFGGNISYLAISWGELGGLVAVICPELIVTEPCGTQTGRLRQMALVIFVGGEVGRVVQLQKSINTTSATKWGGWKTQHESNNWCSETGVFAKRLLTTIVPLLGPYIKADRRGTL